MYTCISPNPFQEMHVAEDWVMVRVRRSTHLALARMINERQGSADRAQMTAWWDGEFGPTFDELLAWLVARVENDRRRAAASRARVRARRREELLRAVFDIAAQEDCEE